MNSSSNWFRAASAHFTSVLALSALTVSAQPLCVPPVAGLVSWWRAESNALDSVSGNNGVFAGAAFAAGKVGTAFSFSQTGNNIRVPASASLDVGSSGGLTIEGWINSTDNTYGRPIAEWVSPTVGGYAVHFFAHVGSPGTLYADLYDTSNNDHILQSAPGLILNNVFQHVAVTYDKASGTGRLYINGSIVKEASLGVFIPQTSPDLSIGFRPSTVPFGPIPFIGLIDELSIYSRALATSEIQAIFQAGSAGKCAQGLTVCTPAPSGLVSLWRGEGTGHDSVAANNAVLLNGVGFTNGEAGQAFIFDGSSTALRVPAAPALDVGAGGGFSVEGWIKPSNANLEQDLVEWNDGAGFIGVHFSLSVPYLSGGPGSLWANLVDPNGTAHQISTGTNLVASGVYQHVALSYSKSSGNATIFLNGAIVGQTNLGAFTPYTSSDLYVGWRPSGPFTGLFYGGAIDELAVYNRELSPIEVKTIYNAGSSSKCPVAPKIVVGPANLAANLGSSTAFQVIAGGDLPLSYQWLFNGNAIAGATASAFSVPNVQASSTGNYSVVVSNSAGTAVSSAATLSVNSAQPCVPPPAGLVGWWRGEGNDLDSAGTNNGSPVNGVSFVPGETGQAFKFTAIASGVNLGNPTNLQLQNFTLEAWIKRDSATSCSYDVYTIAHILGAAWGGYGIGLNDKGNIFLSKIGYSNVYSTNAVTDTNGFHHIVVTKSGTTVTFFIDGAVETAAPYDPGFVFNGTFAIGARGSDYNSTFRGAVDEASIYNRPLTAQEVQSLYSAGSAGKCATQMTQSCLPTPAGQVAWWRGEGNAKDSQNGIDGTFTNPQYGVGEVGNAFSFDGSGNNVRIPASPVMDVGAGSGMTIESWIYSTDSSYARPIVEWVSPIVGGFATHFYAHQHGPGVLYADLYDTANNHHMIETPAGLVHTNAYQHVALTYDKSSGIARLFVNGSLAIESNLGIFTPQTSPDLSIGYRPNTVPFGPIPFFGRIDEVSLYSRALSSSEVQAVYNAGSAGKCATQTQSCSPPASGHVAWWRGEGNANDSQNGINGTFSNPQYANGEVGSAFSFDGSGNNVRIPASPVMDVGSGGGMTIESWIYSTDASYARPIVEWVSPTIGVFATHFYAHQHGPGVLYADLYDTANNHHMIETPPGLVHTNAYQHVALTYDKSSGIARLFVNGSLAMESNLGSFTPQTSPDLSIGYRPNTVPFGPIPFFGRIDEVSLYSRALSLSEVAAVYTAGSAGKCLVPTLPIIVTQPANQSATVGANVSFSVAAAGTPPITYQWRSGGANLPGATDAKLSLTNVQLANAGSYSVVVSNAAGTVVSSPAVLTVNAGSCVPPPTGLISWWKGDSNALDSVGGNNGVLENGTNYASGEVQRAFSFNGINQWVEIPDSPSLNPSNALTLETWVYVTGNPNTDLATIVTKFSTTDGQLNQYQLETHILNGKLNFRPLVFLAGGYVYLDGTTIIQFNTWYHVAMTYDGSALKLYVNGALDGSVPGSGPIPAKPVPLRIGGPSGGPWWFNGRVDEVSLYDRALSASEIQAVYNAGASGKCPTSVAPTIEVQPQDLSVTVGGNASFSTVVAGSLPMSLQWTFNSVPVPGATNSSLSLSNISQANAGPYSLVAMNSAGSATSSVATLTVTLGPTLVQIGSSTVAADGSVTVPVNLLANGNENAVSFSIDFDPTLLTYQGAALSTGASNGSLLINSSQIASGQLGVAIAMPAGVTFGVGTRHIALITFSSPVVPNATSTTVGFGDAPVARLVVTATGLELQANFTSGMLTLPGSAMEGDVWPRPAGDGSLTISDWVQVGRYVAGLDSPTNGVEFQRADCAPRSTLGDGALTVSDWVQAGRYAAGLDPAVRAGGPTSAMPAVVVGAVKAVGPKSGNARQVSLVAPVLSLAETGTVEVAVQALGDENALGFSLSYDATKLEFTGAILASSAKTATLDVNSNHANQGQLGLILALPTGQTFPAGTNQLVDLNFRPITPKGGSVPVAFADQPVIRGVADANASTLSADYVNGTVVISAPPSLNIVSSSAGVTLTWPSAATGFLLQESSDSSLTPSSWAAVNATAVVVNNQNVVTIQPSSTKHFYRLYHP